jgi:hypothetical protein
MRVFMPAALNDINKGGGESLRQNRRDRQTNAGFDLLSDKIV